MLGGHSGRLRTSRTPENIKRVQQALEENANLSLRRTGLDLSYSLSYSFKAVLNMFLSVWLSKTCVLVNFVLI